jgi:hypothetical protein
MGRETSPPLTLLLASLCTLIILMKIGMGFLQKTEEQCMRGCVSLLVYLATGGYLCSCFDRRLLSLGVREHRGTSCD